MKPDDRLIHMWRWLVDDEINLKNSRRMYDKLREQQTEELEVLYPKTLYLPSTSSNSHRQQEMENYMGQVRELSEKRTIDMENETTRLHEQIEAISAITSGVILQGETLVERVCLSSQFSN